MSALVDLGRRPALRGESTPQFIVSLLAARPPAKIYSSNLPMFWPGAAWAYKGILLQEANNQGGRPFCGVRKRGWHIADCRLHFIRKMTFRIMFCGAARQTSSIIATLEPCARFRGPLTQSCMLKFRLRDGPDVAPTHTSDCPSSRLRSRALLQ